MSLTERAQILGELRSRIHQLSGSTVYAERSQCPTGFSALDQLLANRGFAGGTLIEWRGEGEGSGTATLALAVAGRVLGPDRALVVIDRTGEFYPPAADQLGIPLDRLIVVRPDTPSSALWTWEQALRCPGVAVTLGWLDFIDDRVFRRLQLAAETGGGLGFLLRPPQQKANRSWAALQLCVKPLQTREPDYSLRRRLRVGLARRHGENSDLATEVELDDETGSVPLVS